ncbi:MAG: ATP-binding protein [Bacteroidetes bacterium]|nr:ATP-binding protein [Bacteroidota bacterium]
MPDDIKINFQEQYKYDIKTQHPFFEGEKLVGTENFEIEEESTGTKSLFVIGGIILDALETGKVLVVDEFEKNLHPGITQFLIKLFHNPLTNPRNAQLIFATHDITQLSHDNFRRDQVWFSEKNEFGATTIYQCSDIKGIRLGTPLDKWYSTGRFGATPIINDVDFLIEMQEDEA